jgi:hypothetical protein
VIRMSACSGFRAQAANPALRDRRHVAPFRPADVIVLSQIDATLTPIDQKEA